ncbi:mitochondrial translation release factor in rescue [Vespula pensylvanica]|uniref:mitochondrial translation release factor in rescue n=1 Tax=Vespula pensylvanica TaxID=30213 RepID=UPI001CBA2676|nr:mitochondrial translation release factor in rescue [Vespula pensylvanica]
MNIHVNALFSRVASILSKRSLFYDVFQCIDKKILLFHIPSCCKKDKETKLHHAQRTSFYNQVRLKSFKRYLDYSKVPTIDENELEERFVKGSGPGGQATNKTNNAVTLKHKPTGIVVKCHETRSLWINQKRAREIMITKLDNLLNGDQSIESQERVLGKKMLIKKRQRQKKLSDLKKSFKEREGLV